MRVSGNGAQTALANTFTKTQTVKPDTAYALSVVDTGSKEVWRVSRTAGVTLGHASAEALVNYRGHSDQVQFQTGLDVANAPTYSDLVLAARVETWDGNGDPASVSDFVVVRNGQSATDPPRLGVGTYPLDGDNGTNPTNKGVVETAVWGTAHGLTFANFLARIRTSLVQTGPAFAVVNEVDRLNWKVAVDGSTTVYAGDVSNTVMASLGATGNIYAKNLMQADQEISARNSDVSNKVVIGEVGPSSEPGIQVVNSGTTLYRASSFSWRTPGYFTADRTATFGGSHSDNESPLTVKGHSSTQTADLIVAQHNSATVWSVTKDGRPRYVAANEQTTVGAAGAASALPATPTKYLKVVDSAGTTLVIPAYAAS